MRFFAASITNTDDTVLEIGTSALLFLTMGGGYLSFQTILTGQLTAMQCV